MVASIPTPLVSLGAHFGDLTSIPEVSKKDLDKLGLFGSMLGHIGDGNFHETILYDGKKEYESVSKCVHDMVHRAIEMEGTCTVSHFISISIPDLETAVNILTYGSPQGEHGIGLGKKEFLVEEVGEESISVMRAIKESLDPHWLMNPGKVFD